MKDSQSEISTVRKQQEETLDEALQAVCEAPNPPVMLYDTLSVLLRFLEETAISDESSKSQS